MRLNCDSEGVKEASRILSEGGVVVFPTDTVYGVGCNPFDKNAVKRIYKIKNREPSKPLPVLTYSKETAEKIVEFDRDSERIADTMWPGPLTIILKTKEEKIKESLNVEEKVAVRVPNHRCTLELLRLCRYVVGTSANLSGSQSTTDPEECERDIVGYDLLLDGGKIAGRGESTIIEMSGGELKIHREGEIKKGDILGLL